MTKVTQAAKAVMQSPQVREVAQAALTAALVVVHRQLGELLKERLSGTVVSLDDSAPDVKAA